MAPPEHEETPGKPCPRCKYTRPVLPSWVRVGAHFALKGVSYRIVLVISVNDCEPTRWHHRDIIQAEKISDPWERLPSAPATVSDVLTALDELKKLPVFKPSDLIHAWHIEVSK